MQTLPTSGCLFACRYTPACSRNLLVCQGAKRVEAGDVVESSRVAVVSALHNLRGQSGSAWAKQAVGTESVKPVPV